MPACRITDNKQPNKYALKINEYSLFKYLRLKIKRCLVKFDLLEPYSNTWNITSGDGDIYECAGVVHE